MLLSQQSSTFDYDQDSVRNKLFRIRRNHNLTASGLIDVPQTRHLLKMMMEENQFSSQNLVAGLFSEQILYLGVMLSHLD